MINVKEKWINVSAIVLFVVVIGILSVIFVPNIIENYQVRNAAKGVLDHVIEQEYEHAFEYVYYYDQASDLEPIISYSDGKNKWVSRVKSLKETGTFVIDYTHLRIWQDDGYPMGEVDLVLTINGKKVKKEDVRLWFGKTSDGWKLGNFDYYRQDKEETWEHVLSGNLN
jgi:archaellum component FlaF (FlaF/FlaG flagellin family)